MDNIRILHIDDDEDDQEIFLTALLEVTRNVIYSALGSAAAALKQLNANELKPDVIFLDLNMPEMNGQQFLVERNKYESLKRIPVIVLSTSAHKPTIQRVKELGAKDFITKPDSFEELINKLRLILG